MFDIVHEIEGCPPRLLSASRKFIRKFDVTVVKDNEFSRMGDHLTLFIFNDCVEITKVRSWYVIVELKPVLLESQKLIILFSDVE